MPSINSSAFSDPEKYTSGKPLNPAAPPTSGLGKLNLAGSHCLKSSCGIRVIMASDHGWPCHEFKLSTTKDPPCRGALHVKSGESSNVLPLNRLLETGCASRRPGQGRRRATTPNEDHYLVLTARRHRKMNATFLQQHLRSATGTMVSTQTVQNLLHGVGLYARPPMVCVRLTSRHRRDRREWATENVNWRRNEWSNVLFSDESRFSVHPDNRRIFIWRDRGSRNNPAFVHEGVRFGGVGVFVYGGISIDGRTDLYIIRDGPLTAHRYRDEILRPIVVLYAAAIGDDFILMDDNCRPHRANLVEDFLFEEGIARMEWPVCSPDMNPIDHNGSNSFVAQREHRLLRDLRKGPISRVDLSKMIMKFEDTGDLGVLPGRGRIRSELKASKSLLLWWKERPVQSILQQVVDQCHVSRRFRC
ncbi:transposable element Tcb2 transposase [Trichonephila clavipes]|nr:transposable element Tcb2 transposase [Trichonephila clavipes]